MADGGDQAVGIFLEDIIDRASFQAFNGPLFAEGSSPPEVKTPKTLKEKKASKPEAEEAPKVVPSPQLGLFS